MATKHVTAALSEDHCHKGISSEQSTGTVSLIDHAQSLSHSDLVGGKLSVGSSCS